SGIPPGHSVELSYRPIAALLVRRIEGGFRRHGARIWALLRHAYVRLTWRLPDRTQSFRRGTARIPQLSDPLQPDRQGIQGFWLQGETSPRQHSLRGRRQVYVGLRAEAALR